MTLRLEVFRGDEVSEVVEPDGDVVRLGRSASGDIVIGAARDAIALARILVGSERLYVEDLGGGTTVLLRGSERTAVDGGEPVELRDGDAIDFQDGESEAGPRLRVRLEPDREPEHVVELRPLESLARPPAPVDPGRVSRVLATLHEVQQSLAKAPALDDVLATVADASLSLLPRATHATLVLREDARRPEGGGEALFVPVLTRVRGADGKGTAPAEPVRVARSIFRKVVRERAAVLAADAPSEVLSTESLLGASIRSTIAVPLWKGADLVGVLQVDNRDEPAMFDSSDVDVLAILAVNASLAVANAQLISRLTLAEEKLSHENRFLKGRDRERRRGAVEIVGKSPALSALLRQIDKVADTRATVLIEGETGSGKELVANAVHERSRRRDRLFVAQNCAALPETLLESELFGHKRGAFTGATEEKKGLFELADGGTLFLDEVTEMPLGLQAKLLRALQEGEIRRVGSTQTRSVDVRIVAATNKDLEAEVAAGRFREDLFYRLKVFPLRVPPLRERRDDVALLAEHHLVRYSRELGKTVTGFSAEAMALLTSYDWPGNVRELSNEVQRLVIEAEPGETIGAELLSPKIRQVESRIQGAGTEKGTLKDMMEQVERHLIQQTLKDHDNNKTNAAKALGITREGLHKKLRQLKIG